MLVYFLLFECSLKDTASVHWHDVTTIDDADVSDDQVRDHHHRHRGEGSVRRLVFTDSASPSESIMGKSVSIDMPSSNTHGR